MKTSLLASRSDHLNCPLCEKGRLRLTGRGSMTCQSCGTHLHGAMLATLRSISTLPNTLGSHACGCGHPEMRHLPDGTFHCPACGSEVLPLTSCRDVESRADASRY
jgi:ribosomal protein L37AE/L43A